MALTHSALISLVKRETYGLSLRSLGELTACREEIDIATVRSLLTSLFSIRSLFCLTGAEKAANLAGALHLLLERYQYGEIIRGRAILDLTNRIFERLITLSGDLEGHASLGARLRLRRRAVQTEDLEEELSRMLNIESVPKIESVIDLTAPLSYAQHLESLAEIGRSEHRHVTLAAMDLLRDGERLPELLPILETFASRGMLLALGLIAARPRRGRSTGHTVSSSIAYFVFQTSRPWKPAGVFSRVPAVSVAVLYDPASESTNGDAGSPAAAELDLRSITEKLAHPGGEADRESAIEEALGEEEAASPPEETADAAAAQQRGGRSKPRDLRRWLSPEKPRRTTIGFKLISITSVIVVASLLAMILVATSFFSQDVTIRIEENNHTLAQVTALSVQREFQTLVSKTQLFLNMIGDFSDVPGAPQTLETAFFASSGGIGYVGTPGGTGYFNDSLLDGRQLRHEDLLNAIASHRDALAAAESSTTSVVNLTPELKTPMVAIVIPFRKGGSFVPVAIVTSLDPFVQAVQTSGITQLFVVNGKGRLIVDPDQTLLGGDVDYSKLPIVSAALTSPIDNGELQYLDSHRVRYLGSFKRVGFGGLSVVAAAPARNAFASVRAIERRNFYLLIAVLAIAVLVIYYFSKTLTRPVGRLVEASRQVEVGNFLLDLTATTHDEIGLLTDSFVRMGRGLHERERIKDAFGKFVSKSVAEQAMREEVRLGGERKVATVFFSDIRSFTAISEKLQPEEIVEFLNEYMSRMVECVNETGGVVDKFIGDAIMAVWGIPVSRGNDAENAIQGALMMRAALQEFNRGRGTSSRPVIRIGCGINSGPVVAGQIGSTERMEYTVIGDPVNLASRIEALNKPFGTDILISQDTYELVREIFDVVPQLKIKVKGKSAPQQIYAVLGRKDDLHRPKDLRALQRRIGVNPAAVNKKKAANEEVKYEILDE